MGEVKQLSCTAPLTGIRLRRCTNQGFLPEETYCSPATATSVALAAQGVWSGAALGCFSMLHIGRHSFEMVTRDCECAGFLAGTYAITSSAGNTAAVSWITATPTSRKPGCFSIYQVLVNTIEVNGDIPYDEFSDPQHLCAHSCTSAAICGCVQEPAVQLHC